MILLFVLHTCSHHDSPCLPKRRLCSCRLGILGLKMESAPNNCINREKEHQPLDSKGHLHSTTRPPCSLFKSRNIPAKARSLWSKKVYIHVRMIAHVRKYDWKRLEAGCQMLLAGYVCRLCPHSLSLWLRPRGPHRRPAMDRTWATIWTMVSARTCAWATSSQKHDCANKEQWLLNPINPCWLIIGYRDLLGIMYMGLSENRVYSQWNSHLIGIMISKTIG